MIQALKSTSITLRSDSPIFWQQELQRTASVTSTLYWMVSSFLVSSLQTFPRKSCKVPVPQKMSLPKPAPFDDVTSGAVPCDDVTSEAGPFEDITSGSGPFADIISFPDLESLHLGLL